MEADIIVYLIVKLNKCLAYIVAILCTMKMNCVILLVPL